MMGIYIWQLALPMCCFAIGVMCGRRSVKYKDAIISECADDIDECIQHVGYTPEQCGRDK